jgi:hypothetical protein
MVDTRGTLRLQNVPVLEVMCRDAVADIVFSHPISLTVKYVLENKQQNREIRLSIQHWPGETLWMAKKNQTSPCAKIKGVDTGP